MKWNRTNPRDLISVLPQPAENEIEIIWKIPMDQTEGMYRIRHMGTARNKDATTTDYEGMTNVFQVRMIQIVPSRRFC